MNRLLLMVSSLALACGLGAAELPVTPYTVVAKVDSFEHYRSLGGANRFGPATPQGNEYTIVATILQPKSLAGREIAIPFESKKDGKELLVQPGTVFRFEHRVALADLRYKTDNVKRRAIEFPALGIIVLKADGEVAEAYEGELTPLMAEKLKKQAALAATQP